jgi:hypothetical protein
MPENKPVMLPQMSVEQLAKTLGRARLQATTEERERCAMIVEAFRDAVRGQGREELAQLMEVTIGEIRAGLPVQEQVQPITMDAQRVPGGEAEVLPPVRHYDDFSEGAALVQGSRFRGGIYGYQGRTGHLRDGG